MKTNEIGHFPYLPPQNQFDNEHYPRRYIAHDKKGKVALTKDGQIKWVNNWAIMGEVELVDIPKDCYDTDCKLIEYRDSRDEGFILSMKYDKPEKVLENPEFELTHQRQVIDARAVYAVQEIVEHFVCVIENMEKGKM